MLSLPDLLFFSSLFIKLFHSTLVSLILKSRVKAIIIIVVRPEKVYFYSLFQYTCTFYFCISSNLSLALETNINVTLKFVFHLKLFVKIIVIHSMSI